MIERYVLVAALGYLAGSVPFGLYAARYGSRPGLRPESGMGSRRRLPATPNFAPLDLFRRSGRRLAGVAFLLELLKGFAPTFTGYMVLGIPGAVGGGSATLVGHNFPLFAGFRGSNSLAPFVGVLLAFYPLVVVLLAMVWTASLAAWRYASLAALVTAAVAPLSLAALDAGGDRETLVVGGAAFWSVLVFFAHRDNIRKLLAGREARINVGEGRGDRRVR